MDTSARPSIGRHLYAHTRYHREYGAQKDIETAHVLGFLCQYISTRAHRVTNAVEGARNVNVLRTSG